MAAFITRHRVRPSVHLYGREVVISSQEDRFVMTPAQCRTMFMDSDTGTPVIAAAYDLALRTATKDERVKMRQALLQAAERIK